MARGTQFLDLVTRVKSKTGRAQSVAVGVDDLPRIQEEINLVYAALYLDHDWPHLRKVFDRIPLQAGERYYDLPDGLNVERVESACVYWTAGINTPLIRGISAEHYNAYDSVNDDRVEPAFRWDVRWTGSSDQIEIWPIPNTNDQELEFTGIQAAPRLVADADVCLLDDTLVVLFASAALTKGEEAEKILKLAQGHFQTLKARSRGGDTELRLGLGHVDAFKRYGATIVVRG
jgi:hypothetical protein